MGDHAHSSEEDHSDAEDDDGEDEEEEEDFGDEPLAPLVGLVDRLRVEVTELQGGLEALQAHCEALGEELEAKRRRLKLAEAIRTWSIGRRRRRRGGMTMTMMTRRRTRDREGVGRGVLRMRSTCRNRARQVCNTRVGPSRGHVPYVPRSPYLRQAPAGSVARGKRPCPPVPGDHAEEGEEEEEEQQHQQQQQQDVSQAAQASMGYQMSLSEAFA
jgi:hypothetical protein